MREVVLRFLAEPSEVNFGGKVHGGTVMRWIDQAGYSCAVGWSGKYCVTVYVGGIRFLQPIHIGEMVEVKAQVIYTGRTSMHIAVDVWARNLASEQLRKATHCIIVFVAVNEVGQPTEVPTWNAESEQDRALQQYARRLMELRKEIEQEMDPFRAGST